MAKVESDSSVHPLNLALAHTEYGDFCMHEPLYYSESAYKAYSRAIQVLEVFKQKTVSAVSGIVEVTEYSKVLAHLYSKKSHALEFSHRTSTL